MDKHYKKCHGINMVEMTSHGHNNVRLDELMIFNFANPFERIVGSCHC